MLSQVWTKYRVLRNCQNCVTCWSTDSFVICSGRFLLLMAGAHCCCSSINSRSFIPTAVPKLFGTVFLMPFWLLWAEALLQAHQESSSCTPFVRTLRIASFRIGGLQMRF